MESDANFKLRPGGGKATKGKDAWWLTGYPAKKEASQEEEKPLITDKQLSEIGPGTQVFHKSFGYGEVVDVGGKLRQLLL